VPITCNAWVGINWEAIEAALNENIYGRRVEVRKR
jgi:hypothetical protein